MLWGWLIPGWLKRAAAWVALAAAALLGAWTVGRQGGGQAVKKRAAEDTIKRAEKGRKGAAKAKGRLDAGESPEDVARKNDGRWQ